MNLIATSGIAKIDGMGVGVVRFTQVMEVLSCAILNGGNRRSSSFFIMQVNRDYSNDDPASDAARVRDVLGLPEDSVGMMTAAEVEHVFSIAVGECNGTEVTAIATAGLSNHVVAGDLLENYPERRIVSDSRAAHLAGTINIAVLSPVPLTEEGKVNIFIPLVEAKSAAMADRGYRETGTTSDSMAVFSPVGGERISYTGTGSDIGIAAARAVRSAVGQALEARGEHPVMEEPLRLLRNNGYDIGRMRSLSGSSVPEEEFESLLVEVLGEPRLRAIVDLALFSADRADSMADDGHPEERDIIIRAAEDYTGMDVGRGASTVEAVLTAVSRYVVRGNE